MQLSDKAKELIDLKLKDHPKRLAHVYGVAKMAAYLAPKYNIDIDVAMACGYFHDYSKYDDPAATKDILTKEEYEECLKYPFLFHAYLSAYYFRALVSDDVDMFNAIHNHVFGRPGMSDLEKIIMISDFTEETRTYPECIACRRIIMDGNVDLAVYESLVSTMNVVKEKGEEPHPLQLEVYNEYKERINRK